MPLAQKTYSDAGRNGGFVASEAPGRVSREQDTLGPLTAVALSGTILGRNTTSKLLYPLNLGANDGTQTVESILWHRRNINTANARCATIARGPAEVIDNLLIYPSGATTNQKAAIVTALAAKGIIVRPNV